MFLFDWFDRTQPNMILSRLLKPFWIRGWGHLDLTKLAAILRVQDRRWHRRRLRGTPTQCTPRFRGPAENFRQCLVGLNPFVCQPICDLCSQAPAAGCVSSGAAAGAAVSGSSSSSSAAARVARALIRSAAVQSKISRLRKRFAS